MAADPVWFAAWRSGVHRGFRLMVELSDMDVAMVALAGLVAVTRQPGTDGAIGPVRVPGNEAAARNGGAGRPDPRQQRL
jgi:hypothetical protein